MSASNVCDLPVYGYNVNIFGVIVIIVAISSFEFDYENTIFWDCVHTMPLLRLPRFVMNTCDKEKPRTF